MTQCHCLRCGHSWYVRGNYRVSPPNFNPKRCALCRSPLWNKPYVRDYSKTGLLNPKSSFDLKQLPSHNAGIVSSKQLEIPADKYVRVKGAKLQSPFVVRTKRSPARSKISRLVKPRGVRVVVKRGKKIKHTTKTKNK
jgi:hypothetical protein